MAVSPIAISKAIKGIDFPASKEDLIEHAKQNQADKEVIDLLENLSEDDFETVADVEKAYGEERQS
ncbi:DUF2795 domain-containing protein [Pseudanabaena sp. FACHB-2040]|uniref:DUF2795 domain-containing protein n=1 Tax=Pseudanabaena sp. FACHB-2040 TaxID=2692859 RepID=UPI0016890762|nr:DUF2795 domain-containing protein [Pseudanabaena sp. FACHB-2040]MBD2256197.1 DUF2795 domain-containing protein [Pseudanabaena sp. FACHB-2040]